MTVDEALTYLRDAKGALDHVSFTGGEPFLRFSRLETLVQEAKSLGYVVSVMTSGYWAKTPETTMSRLESLKKLGLDMIGVSLDRYHLEFIDESRCTNIAEACMNLQIPLAVRVISAPDDHYGDHLKTLLAHTPADVHVNHMVRLGRAATLPESSFKTCLHPPKETCETVTAIDVLPGGEVCACCGPGLYMNSGNPLLLGNARKEILRDILEKGLINPFMKVINTRGPYGLLLDLQDNGYAHLVPVRKQYSDACQLCLDICNNPQAVRALETIYADTDVRRQQNASQFLKMAGEFMHIQRIKKEKNQPFSTRPADHIATPEPSD